MKIIKTVNYGDHIVYEGVFPNTKNKIEFKWTPSDIAVDVIQCNLSPDELKDFEDDVSTKMSKFANSLNRYK